MKRNLVALTILLIVCSASTFAQNGTFNKLSLDTKDHNLFPIQFKNINQTSSTEYVGMSWYDNGSSSSTYRADNAARYGIYRTKGLWSAPNYQQLELQWSTGIILYPGYAYGKSYVDVRGNGIRISDNTNGKLGVGTLSPSERVEVHGNVFVNNENNGFIVDAGGKKRIGFMKYSGREAGIWRVAGQDFEIGRDSDASLVNGLQSATVDFKIDGNGKVGIGTTTPSAKLDVRGSGDLAAKIYSTSANNANIWTMNSIYSYAFGVDQFGNGGILKNVNNPTYLMHFNSIGNVGIGTLNTSVNGIDYKLAVNGKVIAKEVRVKTDWADFVFEDGYDIKTIAEVEKYIKENRHLPDVPKAEEVQKKGVDLGNTDALLLQKIEELTLYIIELNKKIEVQQKQIDLLK